MNKKVLIRGAGDLATGIAVRLHHCGFKIMMTDIAVPTTVRRTVAFSPAIYEGISEVEGIRAVFSTNLIRAENILNQGNIPIFLDEAGEMIKIWKPDIVVDAIIAKKNLGTTITDAPVVIAIGPGFEAGTDCHCVIESQRGHDLGKCIYSGHASPNTGVPGIIGGYAKERIIRAPRKGIFKGAVAIGSMISAGECVGYVDDEPVTAKISGVVRGLLQDGVQVTRYMKSGDIDPRGILKSCFTVSDKAMAIAGGVLEAILHLSSG